jgi:hypothetical protein
MSLEEPQDRRVALMLALGQAGGKHAGDPRISVAPVDAEDVVVVLADLGRGDGVDAVAIPEMGDQILGDGLMGHPRQGFCRRL